jgi:hypothetical protein
MIRIIPTGVNRISSTYLLLYTTNSILYEFDQFAMYAQILKKIILTTDFEQEYTMMHLLLTVANSLSTYIYQMTNLPCFLYSMLNKALRTMEVYIITKLLIFVRDLHIGGFLAVGKRSFRHTKPLTYICSHSEEGGGKLELKTYIHDFLRKFT